MHHFLGKGSRPTGAYRVGKLTGIGGFESATFTSKRYDLIRLILCSYEQKCRLCHNTRLCECQFVFQFSHIIWADDYFYTPVRAVNLRV